VRRVRRSTTRSPRLSGAVPQERSSSASTISPRLPRVAGGDGRARAQRDQADRFGSGSISTHRPQAYRLGGPGSVRITDSPDEASIALVEHEVDHAQHAVHCARPVRLRPGPLKVTRASRSWLVRHDACARGQHAQCARRFLSRPQPPTSRTSSRPAHQSQSGWRRWFGGSAAPSSSRASVSLAISGAVESLRSLRNLLAARTSNLAPAPDPVDGLEPRRWTPKPVGAVLRTPSRRPCARPPAMNARAAPPPRCRKSPAPVPGVGEHPARLLPVEGGPPSRADVGAGVPLCRAVGITH